MFMGHQNRSKIDLNQNHKSGDVIEIVICKQQFKSLSTLRF